MAFVWNAVFTAKSCEKPRQELLSWEAILECCQKCFSHRSTRLNIHSRTPTQEKPYQCGFCQQCFSQCSSLNIHSMRTHIKEKPYQCDNCDLKCLKPFLCTYCGVLLPSLETTRRHVLRHRKKYINLNSAPGKIIHWSSTGAPMQLLSERFYKSRPP